MPEKRQNSPIVVRSISIVLIVLVLLLLPTLLQRLFPSWQHSAQPLQPDWYQSSAADREMYAQVMALPIDRQESLQGAAGRLGWKTSETCVAADDGLHILAKGPFDDPATPEKNLVPTAGECRQSELSLTDFALQVDVTLLKGRGLDGAGFALRIAPDGADYRIQASEQGSYRVMIHNWVTVAEGPSRFRLTEKQTKTMTLIARGDLFLLYLDGEPLYRYTMPGSHHAGALALMAFGWLEPTEIVVKNARIWDLTRH